MTEPMQDPMTDPMQGPVQGPGKDSVVADDASWWSSGRHPVNTGQLVMALAFLGLLAVWALVQAGAVHAHDVRWLLPLPWVVAGAVGLLATTLSSRRRWGSRQTGWVTPPPAADEER